MPLHDPKYVLLTASALSFLVTFFTAIPVIQYLRQKKMGQQIRDDGPQRHLAKAGTPTMGGVVIMAGLIAGTVAAAVFFPQQRLLCVLLLGLTLALAGVGSIDDWGKIRRGRSLGLRAREKLLLQLVISAAYVALLVFGLHVRTTMGIPGIGEVELGIAYWPLAILLITGMSNAVNLTDGLDGLAAGTTVATTLALVAVAWYTQQASGSAVATFSASLGAACLAFLWYNRHPAKVFMGDTGSLAIGAAFAGIALALKQEVLLLLIGLIFVIEVASVVIQVISFKTTGKRVFRMSPFHHHLELGGWTEPQIVTRAWTFGIVLSVIGVVIYRFWH